MHTWNNSSQGYCLVFLAAGPLAQFPSAVRILSCSSVKVCCKHFPFSLTCQSLAVVEQKLTEGQIGRRKKRGWEMWTVPKGFGRSYHAPQHFRMRLISGRVEKCMEHHLLQKSETSSLGPKNSHTCLFAVFPYLTRKSDTGGPTPMLGFEMVFGFWFYNFSALFPLVFKHFLFMCVVFGRCVLKSPEYMDLCSSKVGSTEKYRTRVFKAIY